VFPSFNRPAIRFEQRYSQRNSQPLFNSHELNRAIREKLESVIKFLRACALCVHSAVAEITFTSPTKIALPRFHGNKLIS